MVSTLFLNIENLEVEGFGCENTHSLGGCVEIQNSQKCPKLDRAESLF